MVHLISYLKLSARRLLPLSIAAFGLSLVPLLPVGVSLGVTGVPFFIPLFLHLLFFLAAVVLSVAVLSETLGSKYYRIMGWAVLALIFGCIWIVALAPVTATDALVHHLAVPKWWIGAGAIHQIPWHEWSYYPMLVNLAFTGLLQSGGPEMCALYHSFYLLLLIALAASAVLEAGGKREEALFGALMTASLPVFVRLASLPMVDLSLAVFCLSAVVCLVRYVTEERILDIVASGVALGCALSTKYNGLLFASVFLLVAVWALLRGGKGIRSCFVLGVTAFVVYLPWLVKNYIWTGNPVYPLMRSMLGGPTLLLPGAPRALPPLQHRIVLYGENVLDLLLLPIRVFLFGADGDPVRFDGLASPLLLLGFLLPLMTRVPLAQRIYGVTGLTYTALALVLAAVRVRYLAPALPLLSVSSAFVLGGFLKRIPASGARLLIVTIVSVSVLGAIEYAVTSLCTPQVRGAVLGKLPRDQYLSMVIPEYQLIQYVNEKLPESSVLYLLGTGNRYYYFDKSVLSRGYFSLNEIISLLRQRKTAAELREYLAGLGITHLFAHAARVSESIGQMCSPEEREVWNQFNRLYLKGLVQSGDFFLYELGHP